MALGVGIRHDVEPNRLPACGGRRSEFMSDRLLGRFVSLAVCLVAMSTSKE